MERKLNLLSIFILLAIGQNCHCMDAIFNLAENTSVSHWLRILSKKAWPEEIFDKVGPAWRSATMREKLSLKQELVRGLFTKDGIIRSIKLSTLLVRIGDTNEYLPDEAKAELFKYLNNQIIQPKAQKDNLQFTRIITTMYLLQPRQLAARIQKNTFIHNVEDPTERENIINTVARNLSKLEDIKGINTLISSIGENNSITLGQAAKENLIQLLHSNNKETQESLLFLEQGLSYPTTNRTLTTKTENEDSKDTEDNKDTEDSKDIKNSNNDDTQDNQADSGKK